MKRSERLKPIKQLTEARELQAAKALGNSNRQLEEQETRLQELQQYQQEYLKYFQQRGQSGVTAAKLQELQHFLHTLKQAITQQQQMVENVRRECEQKRHQWQQAHGKTVAMDKVVARYRSDEELLADKREQKESDEFAQRGKRDGKS